MYDELAEYSEDNFENMIECWRERDAVEGEIKRMVRWWVKFAGFVILIVTTAFFLGYVLARLS